MNNFGLVDKFKETLLIKSGNMHLREGPVEEDYLSDLCMHNGT